MMKKDRGRIRAGIFAAGLLLATALSGCTDAAEPEDNRVIVEQEAPVAEYMLAAVSRGDVVSIAGVRATYSQLDSQKVSFPVSGKLVSKVYVKKRDKVKKGDLLAELSGGSREAEIEQLEYQIARNKILLQQVDDTENYEISRRWLERIYNGRYYETEGISQLQKYNEYSREDYRDAIALDEQLLSQIRTEVQQSKVYAQTDGSVYSIKENLEGSTSVKDEVVMEIMDSSKCLFVVTDMTYASCVKEGQILELSIVAGSGAGKHQVEPYQMDQWTDAMYFSPVDSGESGAVLEAGSSGTLSLIRDSRENVLTLPSLAVHNAEGKWYVYVVNAEGIREIKWIEVGVQGSEVVEIVGGLEEGEKVVLK